MNVSNMEKFVIVNSVWTKLFVVIFVSALLSTSNAGIAGRRNGRTCSTYCRPNDSPKFQYAIGTTYVYDFNSELSTLILEDALEKSKLGLSSKVEIQLISSCDFNLQLKDVAINDLSSGDANKPLLLSKQFKEALEQYSSQFEFQDGQIENLCSNSDEPGWVTNVKRGILSMLQNTMEDLTFEGTLQEFDINGKCPTQYTQSGSSWGGSYSITKFKDLSSCTSRRHYISTIQSVPYTSNPGINLLSGTVECKQTILQNKIERVECQEEQIFKPFDAHNSGAKNVIFQSLRLSTSYPDTQLSKVDSPTTRTTLAFETDSLSIHTTSDISQPLMLLDEFEAKSAPSIQIDAPTLFKSLIESLRPLDESSLMSLWKKVEKETQGKLLLNALPFVSTASSLTLMRELYLNDQLTDEQAESWLSSVTFIKYPTREMISALTQLLLNQEEAKSEVLLSVSAAINSYCKNVAVDCNKDELILQSIEKISFPLETDCSIGNNGHKIRRAVVALKALGNIGVHPNVEDFILKQCFITKTNPTEVRLAAIDAYRRISCADFSTTPFLDLYSDYSDDTEVRIQTYLISMKCANRRVLEVVERVLTNEVVNQVGSFVWTHLTNLQETGRPDKQAIRTLLSKEILQNKFKTDARKFSRNFENSVFSDEYKIGAGLDANVIFTEESFLPKSVMTNLSLQFLGDTINLVEFGGRFSSPESLLEPIFGPNGYFPDESLSEFLKSSRTKRDTSSKGIARLATLQDIASSKLEKTPGAAIYARIFGHEVLYKDIQVKTGYAIPNVVDENGKKWLSLKNILSNLSTGKKTEFTRSTVLIDADYIVPTISGLPLSLTFHAGSTVGLVAEGRFNVARYMEKKGMEIYGLLRPNFAVNLQASLTIRAGPQNNFVQSGLSVRNVLRSSTAIETSLEIDGQQKIKFAFNLPQKRQDIFEASSKVVFSTPSKVEKVLSVEAVPSVNYKTCIGEKRFTFMGLKLCGEMVAPTQFTVTPSIPVHTSLYLEKLDDFDGYSIEYNLDIQSPKKQLSVFFDTPGERAKVKRRTSLTATKYPTGQFEASFQSPTKDLKASGTFTGQLKTLTITAIDNGERILQLNSSILITTNTVTPHFFLEMFKRPLAELKGTIQLPNVDEQEKSATLDLTLKHATENPIRLEGNYLGKEDSSEISLGVESYFVTGNLQSSVKNRPGHWSSRSVLEYSWKQGDIKSVDISAKVQRSKKGALSKLSTAASFTMSKFPDKNFDFSWELLTSHSFCENIGKFTIGKSTWDAHTLYSLQRNQDFGELRTLLSLINPRADVDYHLEFSHRAHDRAIGTKLIGRTSSTNEFKAKFQYDTLSKPFMHKNVSAEIAWPFNQYEFQSALIEKRKGEFDGEVVVNLNGFKEMKATITYINKSNNLKLDHSVDFRARGFISVPVSGNIGFSVTDKQSHVGCQIFLEGKKPYNSRLSTSVDYSHIRNTHKIEAKVTFNEKKYSSEVIFGQTKNGSRHITLDLFLNQHIFIEAKTSGTYPQKVVGLLTLIPDKDRYPDNKLEANALLSSQNVDVQIEYFGEKYGVVGKLGEGSINGEAFWGNDNRITASANLSTITVADGHFSLQLSTPFEDFKNVKILWTHEINSERWAGKLSGTVEGVTDKSILVEFDSQLVSHDMKMNGIIDITGYQRLETNVVLQKTSNRDAFKITLIRGTMEGLLNVDYKHGRDLSTFGFQFKGFELLPELSAQWDSQNIDEKQLANLRFDWTFPTTQKETIALSYEKQSNPLAYNFSITTPWKKWSSVSGKLVMDGLKSSYGFELDNDASLSAIPKKVSVTFQGTLEGFYFHSNIRSQNGSTNELLLRGHMLTINNVDLIGNFKTGSHVYGCKIKSLFAGDLNKLELTTNFDDKKTEIGLVHRIEGTVGKNEITAWGSLMSGSEKKATIVLENNSQMRKLSFVVTDNFKTTLELEADAVWTGFEFWTITANVKSEFHLLPSIAFESSHNMLNIDQIQNVNNLVVSPTPKSFWDDFLPVHNVSTQTVITKLGTIYSSITWDADQISVGGKLSENSANFDISSTIFSPIKGNFEYKFSEDDDEMTIVGDVTQEAKNIITAKIITAKTASKLNFKLNSTSDYMPNIQFLFSHARQFGKFEAFLISDETELIYLFYIGKAQFNEGNFNIKSRSTVFPSIDKILAECSYKIDEQDLKFSGKYKDENRDHTIDGLASWGQQKALIIKSERDFVAELSIQMNNFNHLVAKAFYNKIILGEIHVNYEPKISDFAFGQHLVSIAIINNQGASTNLSASFGIDPKKIDIILKTPFISWSEIRVYGAADFQSLSRVANFGIHKDQDKLDCVFELKSSKRNETTAVKTEIDILGFKEVREILSFSETVDLRSIQGRFAANAKWSQNNIEVQVNTPLERWRKLKFVGSLDNKIVKRIKKTTASVTCDINERHHEIKGTAKFGSNRFDLDFFVQCLNSYNGKFALDYNVGYSADFDLKGPTSQWIINGNWLNNNMSVRASTPIKGYERVNLDSYYQYLSNSQHSANAKWAVNSLKQEIGYNYIHSNQMISIKIKTPLHGWEELDVSMKYDKEMKNITIAAERNHGQRLLMDVKSEIVGEIANLTENAALKLSVKIESPFEQYRKMNLILDYNRIDEEHNAKIEYSRNDELLKLDGHFLYNHQKPHSVDLKVDLSSFKSYTSKVHATLAVDPVGNSSFSAIVEFNEARHEVNAALDLSKTKTFSLITTLPFLKQFNVSFNAADAMILNGFWEGEDQILDFKSALLIHEPHHKRLNLSIISPFLGIRHIFLDTDLKIKPDSVGASVTFENENHRWVGRLDGSFHSLNGEWNIHLNTPITEYQHVAVHLKHFWNFDAKELTCTIERNAVKFTDLRVSLKDGGIELTLESQVLQTYPISINISSKWGSQIIIVQAGVAVAEEIIEINTQGLVSGMVNLRSSNMPEINTKLAWKLDGSLTDGNAWASFFNTATGTRTFRTVWSANDWKQAKIELWMRINEAVNELGGVFQYAITTIRDKNYKLHIHGMTNSNEASTPLTFSWTTNFWKNSDSYSVNIDFESNSNWIQSYDAKSSLTLAHKQFSVKVDSTFNKDHLMTVDSSILLTVPHSKLTLNFNAAPTFGQPLELFVEYNVATEKKPLEIFYKQADYLIKLKTHLFVPSDKNEMEFNFNMSTNVSSIKVAADGLLKGSYQYEENGLSKITLNLESEKFGKWNFMGSIRTGANFLLSVDLNSTTPEFIPPVFLQAVWRGSYLQGISSNMFLKFKNSMLNGTLSLNPDSVHMTLTTPFEFLKSVNVDGYIQPESNQFEFKINTLGQQYKLVGNCNFSKDIEGVGSLVASKGLEDASIGSLTFSLDEFGNVGAIGSWEGSQIQVKGTIKASSGEQKWIQSGRTNLNFTINGSQVFSINSSHYFLNNEYIFNMTTASDKAFRIHVIYAPKFIVSSTLQWDTNNRVKFLTEVSQNKFDVFLSTPWIADLAGHGQLETNAQQTILEGFIIYDLQKSSARLGSTKSGESVELFIALDIPPLHQKFTTELLFQSSNIYHSGGKLDVNLNGRHLNLNGQFTSQLIGGHSDKKKKDTKLSFSLLLPVKGMEKLDVEISFVKPINDFKYLALNTSIIYGGKTSSLLEMNYNIPETTDMDSDDSISVALFIQNSFKVPFKHGFRAVTQDLSFRDGFVSVAYNSKNATINWKLYLPKIELAFRLVNGVDDYNTIDRYHVVFTGHWDPTQIINLSLNSLCKDMTMTAKYTMRFNNNEIYCEAILNSSQYIFLNNHHYRVEIKKQDNGKYDFELSGTKDTVTIGITGDLESRDNRLLSNAKMSGSFGSVYAKLDYSKKDDGSHETILTLESSDMIAGKKVAVKIDVLPLEDGFETKIQCRTRKSTHSTTFKINAKPENGEVVLNINSPELQPVLLQVTWKKEGSKLKSFIRGNLYDTNNELEALLDVENLEGQMRIDSPLIPSSHFGVHLKSLFTSEEIDIIGDVQIRKYHWRFEGALKYKSLRDMVAMINLLTPHKTFDRVTLALKLSEDEIYGEIYTPISAIPKAMVKINGFQAFQAGNWHDLHPGINISLPFGKYSTFAIFKIPDVASPGAFQLYFEDVSNTDVYELSFEMSPLSHYTFNMNEMTRIYFSLKSPFEQIPNSEFELEGKIRGRNAIQMTAKGSLALANTNENIGSAALDFSYANENGNPTISSRLMTPFEMYEDIAFSLSFQSFNKIGNGRSLHMTVQNSEWMDTITLDTDYRYHYTGFLQLEGEFNAALISFMDIPPVHLHLKTETESGFSGIIHGKVGDIPGSLKVATEFENEKAIFKVNGSAGEDNFYSLIINTELIRQNDFTRIIGHASVQDIELMKAHAIFSTTVDSAGGDFILLTPWGPLQFDLTLVPASIFISDNEPSLSELLNNSNVTMNMRFDDKRLVGIQLVTNQGVGVLEVYNPISPISLMLNFKRLTKNDLYLVSTFCWDIEKPVGHTIGTEFEWNRGLLDSKLGVTMHMEKAGYIDLQLSHSLTSSRFNQTGMVKWDLPLFKTNGQSGYKIFLSKDSSLKAQNYNLSLQIDLPFRSVILETVSSTNLEESFYSVNVKWDALKDETKSLMVKWNGDQKTAWRVTETSHFLEISHPLSQQPIMFSIDKIYKNGRFQLIEFEMKASALPQNSFIFSITRNDTDWKNFKTLIQHIPTNTFVAYNLKTLKNGEHVSSELSYMDVKGSIRNWTLNMVSTENNFYEFNLSSGSMDVNSNVFAVKSHVYLDLITLNNRLFSYDADAIIQTTLPFVEVMIKEKGEDKFKIVGGYSSKKKFGMQVARLESEMSHSFFRANAELTPDNALVVMIDWLPQLFSNLLDLQIPKAISSSMLSDMYSWGVFEGIENELIGRWEQLSPEIRSIFVAIKEFMVTEADVFYRQWKRILNTCGKLYESNAFYIKDILSYRSFFGQFGDSVRVALIEGWSEFVASFSSFANESWTYITKIYEKCEGSLEHLFLTYWADFEEFITKIWQDNVNLISSIFNKVWDASKLMLDTLEGKIEEIENKLMALGLFRKLIQIYRDYATWIEEIPIQEFAKKVEDMLNFRIWEALKKYLAPLLESIRGGVEDQFFKDLLETPPLPWIRYGLKTFHNVTNKFWDALNIGHRLKSLIRASLGKLDGLIHRYIPTATLNYDLDQGIIEYNQSLSAIQWSDFTQLPRWRTTADQIQDVSQLTNFYYEAWDTLENLKPVFNMNVRQILPPFRSYALMSGDYHYFTFDKHYFRFAGECSYLLVADISQTTDAFSLIANYESREGFVRKKSYSITANGSVIEIDSSDFRVTLNGKKVDLPLDVGPLFIRRHQTGLEMYDKRGFTMTCSLSSRVCTLGVSGWHFAKLAGLLGTYDNEPSNDLQTPDRQLLQDVSTFAYSWRVGKNSGICRMKNFAKSEMEVADVDNICYNLLKNRSSPLRPCFNTVETEIFMEMCMYDVSRNLNSANRIQAACSAMSSYVTECQQNKIDVWMPPACVRCRLEDGTVLTTGENATLQTNGELPPPQSSDNVILLDEASCISPSTLGEAMKRLDLALNVKGLKDNRYVVVGYGGSEEYERPHIRTTSSKVWTHNTLFKVSNSTKSKNHANGDLYEAIQYAATLGFRAGVSKNFIAVACEEDSCGDSSRYGDILTLLVENDIKLHLLVTKPFALKGNPKEELNHIYGMDMNGVYTMKNAKSGTVVPDAALKRQIVVPKDFCTPLAMESNGTRFNVEHATKKVLDVWSRRIAQTSNPSDCQRCECVPDRFGSASVMCHQCVSPSLWKFMEEWKSYQSTDGEEFMPMEFFEHSDFIIT